MKLKGSSLMETMVAMVLIVLTFGLATGVINQGYQSTLAYDKLRAETATDHWGATGSFPKTSWMPELLVNGIKVKGTYKESRYSNLEELKVTAATGFYGEYLVKQLLIDDHD